jgi:hypothetical protein
MARDYIEQRQAKTPASAKGRGRDKPYVHDPLPVDQLYKRGEYSPFPKTDGDGLVSKELHSYETRMQKPQALGDHDIDGRLPGYDNDVPITRWVRGKDATVKPGYVFTGNPKPAKGGLKLEASGKDAKASPFSAAAKTWSE